MLQEARPLMNDDSSTSPSISLDDFARQLERSRIQALLARNMQLLWRLHAADYQLITPSGRSFSRDHYLRKIESGDLRYLRWDAGAMEVRSSETLAIVRYQATLELASADGRSRPIQCWHTDCYERKDDTWKAVWSQATEIR